MSFNFDEIPNPPGSPLEKISEDFLIDNVKPELLNILSDNPTKDEILKAFAFYDDALNLYIQRHEREFKYWANIHTHGELIGDGENIITLEDVWTDIRGTLNWDARRYHPGGQVEDKLYILPGSRLGSGTNVNQTNIVDLETREASPPPANSLETGGSWTDTNTKRYPTVLDGYIYQIQSNASWPGISAMARYNFLADSWETREGSNQRGIICAIPGNPHLWQIGESSLRRYDPDTNTWSDSVENMPQVANQHSQSVFGHNGFLYVAGGELESSLSDSLQRYDPVSDTWQFLANAPIEFYWAAHVVYGGRVYIADCGGNDRTQRFLIYTFSTDSWDEGEPFPLTSQRIMGNTAHFGAVGQNRLLFGDEFTYG